MAHVLHSIKQLDITFIVNKHNFCGKEIKILRSVALMQMWGLDDRIGSQSGKEI